MFHASIAGMMALGPRGRQTLFSKAVIDCLVNDAADLEEVNGQERWVISVHRLAKALDIKIADLNLEFGGDQECGFGGTRRMRRSAICRRHPRLTFSSRSIRIWR